MILLPGQRKTSKMEQFLLTVRFIQVLTGHSQLVSINEGFTEVLKTFVYSMHLLNLAE